MKRALALCLCVCAALALAAAPKTDHAKFQKSAPDAGYGLMKVFDTSDAGHLDGGIPFNGFLVGKPLSAEGDFSKAEVLPVVKAHQSEISDCYKALLTRNAGKEPVPQGVALLKFEVGAEGKVINAEVAPVDIKDPTFAACAVERIRAWTFSAPRGGVGVKVAYPMKLRPPD